MNTDIFFSADQTLIDREWVRKNIKIAYWGHWRSDAVINASIDNSLCVGLYYPDPETGGANHPVEMVQVGFARIVGDGATFSWIADVIVDPDHRGKGYGKFLMAEIMKLSRVKNTVCYLATKDAHSMYEKFGFNRHEAMRRIPTKPQ